MYHLKPACRGVHETEWIMSKEDLQFDFLTLLKAQKLVSTKGTYDFVDMLFAVEGGG